MRRKTRFGQTLPPKPVELGKEYDVDIEEISRIGQGVARIKGFVIFAPDTKPNDRVRVKITRISPRFAEAEVVGIAAEGFETRNIPQTGGARERSHINITLKRVKRE